MSDQSELAERVRTALPGLAVREVNMFGGLAFMVNEKLTVSVGGEGDLLIRCDPARVDDLLAEPGASWATMKGKPMGKGWLRVSPDRRGLAFWIDLALEHNRAVTDRAGGDGRR